MNWRAPNECNFSIISQQKQVDSLHTECLTQLLVLNWFKGGVQRVKDKSWEITLEHNLKISYQSIKILTVDISCEKPPDKYQYTTASIKTIFPLKQTPF